VKQKIRENVFRLQIVITSLQLSSRKTVAHCNYPEPEHFYFNGSGSFIKWLRAITSFFGKFIVSLDKRYRRSSQTLHRPSTKS